LFFKEARGFAFQGEAQPAYFRFGHHIY
jgi:hypothetical protein